MIRRKYRLEIINFFVTSITRFRYKGEVIVKDLIDVIKALQDTPVPSLLAIVGAIFIFLAVVGKIGIVISLSTKRQVIAFIVGLIALTVGVILFLLPQKGPPASPAATSTVIMPTPPPTVSQSVNTLLAPTLIITDVPYPTPTPLHVSQSTQLISPNGEVSCALSPDQGVHALEGTRLWSKPDVTTSNFEPVDTGIVLYVVEGPVWGPISYFSDAEGWFWRLSLNQGGLGDGWVWESRLQECHK